jgi:hypothetical protein
MTIAALRSEKYFGEYLSDSGKTPGNCRLFQEIERRLAGNEVKISPSLETIPNRARSNEQPVNALEQKEGGDLTGEGQQHKAAATPGRRVTIGFALVEALQNRWFSGAARTRLQPFLFLFELN